MRLIERQTGAAAVASLLLLASGCAGGEEPSGGANKKPAEQAQSAEGPAPLPAQLPCEPDGTALAIRVRKAFYDKGCLAVPAGEDFTIELTNDDFLEHNVSIYLKENADYADGLFNGELFRGPGEAKTYEIPAIEKPGIYSFRCDEHQSNMKGVFVVAS